jgi:hypothetical protein
VYVNHDAECKYIVFVNNIGGCCEVVACKTYGDYLAFVAAFMPVLESLNRVGQRTLDTEYNPLEWGQPNKPVNITPKSKKPKLIKRA